MSAAHLKPLLGKNDAYIVPTLDGSATLFSRAFQATYHSMNGAVSESRHIFLQQGLARCIHFPKISILEFGFGTVLNAFLAYIFSLKNNKAVSNHGIEAFPINLELARSLAYPEYLAARDHVDLFDHLHSGQAFRKDNFDFRLFSSLHELSDQGKYNCIFFDAFSPKEDPPAWHQDIFDKIAQMTHPGAILVTYCVQGEVRRALERAGFLAERIPGAPGKRQMIRATKR